MNKKKIILMILIIGVVSFIFSNFFYQIGFVNGISMEPTLKSNQVMLVKKNYNTIKNNDIVLIKKNNKVIVKRVVGIPGDILMELNGYLYVNDKKYDNRIIEYVGNLKNGIVLKKHEYYVLGDNRNNSIDSRYEEIGLINENDIKGLVL